MEKFDFNECNNFRYPCIFYNIRNWVTCSYLKNKKIPVFPEHNHLKLSICDRFPYSFQLNRVHKMDNYNLLILFKIEFDSTHSTILKSEHVWVHCFIFGSDYQIFRIGCDVQCKWVVSRVPVFRLAAFMFVYIHIYIPVFSTLFYIKGVKMVQ